jgi:hypothetical protein
LQKNSTNDRLIFASNNKDKTLSAQAITRELNQYFRCVSKRTQSPSFSNTGGILFENNIRSMITNKKKIRAKTLKELSQFAQQIVRPIA